MFCRFKQAGKARRMADENIRSALSRMIIEVNHHLILVDLCCSLGLELTTFLNFRSKCIKQLLKSSKDIALEPLPVGPE
jgi:hypothetical protein